MTTPSPVGRADLLGSPSLVGPGGQVVAVTRPQVQLALAFLLLERRQIERGELAELLWGQQPLADHWQGAIRGVLSKLREHLADAEIDGEVVSPGDGTVRLELPVGFEVDVELARAAIDRAASWEEVEAWLPALEHPFLPAGDGDWVRDAQDQVAELARRAASVHAAGLLADGHPARAADAARTWVRRHPLDEGLHRLLIEALLADGRRAEALDAFGRLEDVLAAELGVAPDPKVAALLRGASTTPATDRRLPRPSSSPGAPDVLLGRTAELELALDAWRSAVALGRPHLVDIGGRSGVGKTRLAAELAEAARAEGATVRWARCTPGTAPPFEPLAAAVEAVVAAGPSDPTIARADALRAIRNGAQALASSPAVLVVDDVQWASEEVLAALDQTVVELEGPLLVVTTGRNLPRSVHEALGRFARTLPTTPIRLHDLTPDELLPLFAHDEEPHGLADELHRRTGGHPLFVSEVAIAPWRAGRPIDPGAVPGGLRSWIRHRADALPPDLRSELDLAATIGETCEVAVLARCGDDQRTIGDVLTALEALVEEGLLIETERPGRFAFAHAITRDAVYERISASRRAWLHGQVADAIAAGPATSGRAAVLADHLEAAGPDRAAEAGVAHLVAGRAALDAGAWADAERHHRRAVELASDRPEVRAGALTGTARSLHLQRRREEAEALLEEALAVARAHRLALELAEAALVLVGRAGRGATQHLTDLEQAALLREALDGLEALDALHPLDPEGASEEARAERVRRDALACRVGGELSLAISLTAPLDERERLIDQAVARAHALDPPDTRVTAEALLVSRAVLVEPEQVPARRALSDQVLAIAPSGRSVDSTLMALTYRHEDLLLCGDRARSQASLDEATALAERSDHPYWRWSTATWRALGDLVDGDLEAAERGAFEAFSLQGGEGGAEACLGVNLVNVRLYQGRSGEVLDLLAAAAEDAPHIPCYRAVHALCAIEAGDVDGATRSFDAFRATAFAEIPRDTNRLLTLVVLADTAVQLGDVDAAAPLRAQLLPWSGLHALLNCYGGGGAYWGPVDHQLGRLDALAGRTDDRDRWFASAAEAARAAGAALALARIEADPMRAATA